MIVEIALVILLMIIIITEFIKYVSEKYIDTPSVLCNNTLGVSCNNTFGVSCNNKMKLYRDTFCSKNRDSNNFCINPPAKEIKIRQNLEKNKQYGDNINNSLGITEDTLFNRDINTGYTLRYW